MILFDNLIRIIYETIVDFSGYFRLWLMLLRAKQWRWKAPDLLWP